MRKTRIANLGIICLFLIACTSPPRSYHKALVESPYDVIIVPGIPYQDQDWGSNVMKARVLWSFYLYSNRIALNVIYSGGAVYTPYVEGKVMALHAIALGIPTEHVFSETKAKHSTENLVYSIRLARELGFKNIAVATDPLQSKTLKLFAWDYALPVAFIPIIYDSLNKLKLDSSVNIDPATAFQNDFIPLPQRENFIKRFMGTLGFGIK